MPTRRAKCVRDRPRAAQPYLTPRSKPHGADRCGVRGQFEPAQACPDEAEERIICPRKPAIWGFPDNRIAQPAEYEIQAPVPETKQRDPSPLEILLARTPFSWLRERDIDLLVCAELHAKGALTRLVASRIGAPDAAFVGAWVSHTEIEGESDLIVTFSAEDGRAVALVENKIAASFQPDQAKRYAARAQKLSGFKGVGRAVTVLLAPGDYMSRPGAESFDLRITYEEATTALQAEGDPRSGFLADALEAAVAAYRRGYVMTPDSAVTEMWMACWRTSLRVAPRLNFQKPGLKPGRSTWICFRDAEGFSKDDTQRVCVVYKAGRGQADLQFRGTARAALAAAAERLLDRTMKVVPATKSASIRIAIVPIDFRGPVEDQQAAITEGFAACERLRTLFVEHGERMLGALRR
jgi:hypothetical protein